MSGSQCTVYLLLFITVPACVGAQLNPTKAASPIAMGTTSPHPNPKNHP